MKIERVLFLCCLFFAKATHAQLYTEYTTASTLDSLVSSVFGSPNVQIMNVRYVAQEAVFNPSYIQLNDLGYFNSSKSTVGFKEGIILTAGLLKAPYGLGVSSYENASFYKNTAGDSILDAIVYPSKTGNAVVLEFDFIPNGDSIQFNYVFASDEYPNQICDEDADVFAFHISGPNIDGLKNIALIPGTNFAVGNNTVNDTSKTIYVDQLDLDACPTVAYPQYYVDHSEDNTFIFNGSTTILTAKEATIPCQTYHLRFAVADGNRLAEHSAVFLAANSFNSNPISIESDISYGNGDTILYEGCGFAKVKIKRTYNIQQEKSYTLRVSGTATGTLDYSSIPTIINLAPGEDAYELIVIPSYDILDDNMEDIILTVGDTLCDGQYYETQLRLIIYEKQDYQVDIIADTNVACEEQLIYSEVNGAVLPITYDWNYGTSVDSILSIYPTFEGDYFEQMVRLKVTDACKNIIWDSISLAFSHPPTADFYYNPIQPNILDAAVDFQNNSTPDAISWQWTIDSTILYSKNAQHLFKDTGAYEVMLIATNQYNCKDSLIGDIIIKDAPVVYVPNSFSPNGDGTNDFFSVVGNDLLEFHIQIFNRWGEAVYLSDRINETWNGENATEGYYNYLMKYITSDGKFHFRDGSIMLLRD